MQARHKDYKATTTQQLISRSIGIITPCPP